MKALTICQPYASLIIGWPGMPEEERKPVENRTWHCHYRGPLLIHAGKSKKYLDTWDGPVPEEMLFGVILGQVRMVGCRTPLRLDYPLRMSIHVEGPFCFVLRDPQRFDLPIPFRGQKGMFDVPADAMKGMLAGVMTGAVQRD